MGVSASWQRLAQPRHIPLSMYREPVVDPLRHAFAGKGTPQEIGFINGLRGLLDGVEAKARGRGKVRICPMCGAQFRPLAEAAKRQRYCSARCRDAAARLEKVCKHCGRPFTGTARKRRQMYCSVKCHNAHQVEQYPAHTCVVCGKEFRATKRGQPTCGIPCGNIYRRRKMEERKHV